MTDSRVWALYARRSVVREGDANVSIDSQRDMALRRVPSGAAVEMFVDGGVGHHSGGSTDGRPEYRRMLEWLDAGRLAGIAAYDDTRLNRAADEQIRLFKACAARGVLLRTDDSTATVAQMFDDGGGTKLTTLVKAGAAEYQLDQMRKKARDAASHTFAAGGVWAKTPFGYRTEYDPNTGRVLRVDGVARRLRIEPDEAAVVARVFDLLPDHPFSEIAAILNAEQAAHGPTPKHQRTGDHANAWTTSTVKDCWRRREFYAGRVTSKRGLLVGPGRHEAIISEEVLRDAVVGIERRRGRRAAPASAKRVYLLRGLVFCACGAKMRGETRKSRGKEWRYYTCPVSDGRSWLRGDDGSLVTCTARRVPAIAAESAVFDGLVSAILAPEAVAEQEAVLRSRLAAPAPGATDSERQRLTTRLRKLADLYGWGDLPEAEYRKAKREAESALAALPAPDDKIVVFGQRRAVFQSLGDELAEMSPEEREAVAHDCIERVETRDQQVVRIVPVASDRPFLSADCWGLWSPRADSNRRRAP